jgi:hypothetical protein
MELDLIAAPSSKLSAGLSRLDEDARNGADGSSLGREKGSFLDFSIGGFRVKKAEARDPIQMFEVGIHMTQKDMLAHEEFLGSQAGDVDRKREIAGSAGGAARGTQDIHRLDSSWSDQGCVFGAARGLDWEVGEFTLSRRILAG